MNITKDSADTELLLKTKMRKNRQTCSVGKLRKLLSAYSNA